MIHRHESGMACSGTSSWGVFRDLQMCVHRKARDVKNIYCEIYDYSPASSSSLVTGTTLLSFFMVFYFLGVSPGGPTDSQLVWIISC